MNLATNISSLNVNSTELFQENNGINQFPTSVRIFTTVMALVFAIFGFVGNSLTIVALLKCPKVRDVTAAFISSLCLADLAVCVFVLPFDAIGFVDQSWTRSRTLCVVVPYFRYTNTGVGYISIAAITIIRYVMIAHHSVYVRICRKGWIAFIVGSCWVFSYALLVLPLFEIWGRFGRERRMNMCAIVKDSEGRSPRMFLFIVGFLVPTFFIVVCYSRIFWLVNRSRKKMQHHSISPQETESPQKPRSLTRDAKRTRTGLRILKMILAIFLSFIVCHLPITLAHISDPEFKHPGVYLVGYFLFYLSVCVNPIIYGVMNVQYRKAYASVICFWKMRTNSIQG